MASLLSYYERLKEFSILKTWFCVLFFTSLSFKYLVKLSFTLFHLGNLSDLLVFGYQLSQRKPFTILRITGLSARKSVCMTISVLQTSFFLVLFHSQVALWHRNPKMPAFFDLFLSLTGLTQEKVKSLLTSCSLCNCAIASLKCSQLLVASRCLLNPGAESRCSLMRE